MTDQTLMAKLDQPEDPWVERKESFNERETRRTIVGFANALPEGAEPATLFIGASNNRPHPGVADADDTQKKVHAQVAQNSYPPIEVAYKVITVDVAGAERRILAVMVPPSKTKPHFAGNAYIRQGSQTLLASKEVFEELVASQNDTVRKLQRFRGKPVLLTTYSQPNRLRLEYEGVLARIDAHTAEINTNEGRLFLFATSTIEVVYQMPELPHIKAPVTWTEAEQITMMIERWAFFHPDANGLPRDRYAYIPDQLIRYFSVTGPIMDIEAKLNPSRPKQELWRQASFLSRPRY